MKNLYNSITSSFVGKKDVWLKSILSFPNFLIFLLCLNPSFISVVTMAQNNFWEKINSPINGWNQVLAINESGSIFLGTNHGIFRSIDNGTTWSNVDSNFNAYLFAYNFSGTIYTVGDSGLFRSSDDGLNWTLVDAGMTNNRIASLTINDSGHIFAGTYGIGPATRGILRSTDDGVSWIRTGPVSNTFYTLAINASGTLFAGGWANSSRSGGVVWRSIDNGANWTKIFFLGFNPVGEIAFNPDGHIFVGISLFYGNSYNGDGIFSSIDDGVHWISSNFGMSTTSIVGLAINNNGHVFVGKFGQGVYRSTDDGVTWTPVNSGMDNDSVLSIAINPSGTIFAATTGGLFRSQQSTTSIADFSTDDVTFSLNQNYPNPFNPSTKLSFSIPSSEFVTLKVYDLLGRQVAVLVEEEKNAGSYKVDFNGSTLSSGTYFYTLKAGKYLQTKKLILMK